MSNPSSFRDLIAQWPSRDVFAEDIGVGVASVHKWAKTGSVRARYFQRIVDAGQARGLPVSPELLVRLAARAADDHGAPDQGAT